MHGAKCGPKYSIMCAASALKGIAISHAAHSTQQERCNAWPQGIDAFHGLQFLQINAGPVWPSGGIEVLELDHLAFIPHVSLRCQGSVEVNIATGSWKVLEIQTVVDCVVAIADVETFLKSVGMYSFTFPSNNEPTELIRQLREAGAEMGIAIV